MKSSRVSGNSMNLSFQIILRFLINQMLLNNTKNNFNQMKILLEKRQKQSPNDSIPKIEEELKNYLSSNTENEQIQKKLMSALEVCLIKNNRKDAIKIYQ
jgi:hypothetical protein